MLLRARIQAHKPCRYNHRKKYPTALILCPTTDRYHANKVPVILTRSPFSRNFWTLKNSHEKDKGIFAKYDTCAAQRVNVLVVGW